MNSTAPARSPALRPPLPPARSICPSNEGRRMMEARKQTRYLLPVLTLGLLLVLMALPPTGWLLRLQLGMELMPRDTEDNVSAFHMAALRAPNDYPMQLAEALTRPPN